MTEPTATQTQITTATTEPTAELPLRESESVTDEPATFDREYVSTLRAEAAERRTEAKTATERGDELFELLLHRTVEQATADILFDPSDLPRDGDYYDDASGFPSAEKIRAAAEALAEAKPYLSRVRGDVSQGARESVGPVPTLGELVRGAL